VELVNGKPELASWLSAISTQSTDLRSTVSLRRKRMESPSSLRRQTQEIVDVALTCSWNSLVEVAGVRYAATIEGPTVITVYSVMMIPPCDQSKPFAPTRKGRKVLWPVADVLPCGLIRVAAVLRKSRGKTGAQRSPLGELRAAAVALAFTDFRITRPAQRIDELAENLLALGDDSAPASVSGRCAGGAWSRITQARK